MSKDMSQYNCHICGHKLQSEDDPNKLIEIHHDKYLCPHCGLACIRNKFLCSEYGQRIRKKREDTVNQCSSSCHEGEDCPKDCKLYETQKKKCRALTSTYQGGKCPFYTRKGWDEDE